MMSSQDCPGRGENEGNNGSSIKKQRTSTNEKKTTSNPRSRPSMATKKTPSYDSGSARAPSERSPWRLTGGRSQATSISLPTTPVSVRSRTPTAPATPRRSSNSPTPPASLSRRPASSAPSTSRHTSPALSASRTASPAPSIARSAPPALPASRPSSLACFAASPPSPALSTPPPEMPARSATPTQPESASSPQDAVVSTASPESGSESRDVAQDEIERADETTTCKETSETGTDEKIQPNPPSESRTSREEDDDSGRVARSRSPSPFSVRRRVINKRKSTLDQQCQDDKLKMVPTRKEFQEKEKSAAEIYCSPQELKTRNPEARNRDRSTERGRSEGDYLSERNMPSSGKTIADSDEWDLKSRDDESEVTHWSEPEKLVVPSDGLGSWLLQMLQDVSEPYIDLLKDVIKRRDHLLTLVGKITIMKTPIIREDFKRKLKECLVDAEEHDVHMDSVREKQILSASSLGDVLRDLAADHERVKEDLANALKAKTQLEKKAGMARHIARAVAEEKRLRQQMEKMTEHSLALSVELEEERQRNEGTNARMVILEQQLQQGNERVQDLENKLKEQTEISKETREELRVNQAQIQNMIIERCGMLREYTEVKSKADTEVTLIVREMETRMDLVNRRLQEEIEMSERLREENWKFRKMLETAKSPKRAVDDSGAQANLGQITASASESIISQTHSNTFSDPVDRRDDDDLKDDEEEEGEEGEEHSYRVHRGDDPDGDPPSGDGGGGSGGSSGGCGSQSDDCGAGGSGQYERTGSQCEETKHNCKSTGKGCSERRVNQDCSASEPNMRQARRPYEPPLDPVPDPESETEWGCNDVEVAQEQSLQVAVTVWERPSEPVASADTDTSFGFEYDEDSARALCTSGVGSDSSDSEQKRRKRVIITEGESAQQVTLIEEEIAKALEEEMMKMQLEKVTLEFESVKIADEKAELQQMIQEASLHEREQRKHFKKELIEKVRAELIPKEQEIELLQVQIKELTSLAELNKQQFIEYERRIQDLASNFKTPNAEGDVTSLREVVDDLHKQVEAMKQTLQEVRKHNEELESALTETVAEAEAQTQLALRRTQALQTRDAQLRALSAAMRQRDSQSSKIEEDVRRQAEQMTQLQTLLQMRDLQLSHLAKTVEEMNSARSQKFSTSLPPPTSCSPPPPPPPSPPSDEKPRSQTRLPSPHFQILELHSQPPSQTQMKAQSQPQVKLQNHPLPQLRTQSQAESTQSQLQSLTRPQTPFNCVHSDCEDVETAHTQSKPPLETNFNGDGDGAAAGNGTGEISIRVGYTSSSGSSVAGVEQQLAPAPATHLQRHCSPCLVYFDVDFASAGAAATATDAPDALDAPNAPSSTSQPPHEISHSIPTTLRVSNIWKPHTPTTSAVETRPMQPPPRLATATATASRHGAAAGASAPLASLGETLSPATTQQQQQKPRPQLVLPPQPPPSPHTPSSVRGTGHFEQKDLFANLHALIATPIPELEHYAKLLGRESTEIKPFPPSLPPPPAALPGFFSLRPRPLSALCPKKDASQEASMCEEISVQEAMARRVLGMRTLSSLPGRTKFSHSPAWRPPFLSPADAITRRRRSRSLDSRRYTSKMEWPAAGEPGRSVATSVAGARGQGPCKTLADPKYPWCYEARSPPDVAPKTGSARRAPSPECCTFSPYNTFIREHFVVPTDERAQDQRPNLSKNDTPDKSYSGKIDWANRRMWVSHCSTNVNKHPLTSSILSGSGWDQIEGSGISSHSCHSFPLQKEMNLQEAELSQTLPSRDPGLQVPTREIHASPRPPPRPSPESGAAGDGSRGEDHQDTYVSRSLSPEEGKGKDENRRVLSPFRHIAELPKIVQFREDSSMESTDDSTSAMNGSENSEQEGDGKSLIKYKKINRKYAHFIRLNDFPIHTEGNLSSDTATSITIDSKTTEGNRMIKDESTQSRKQVDPYIQNVKRIINNLK